MAALPFQKRPQEPDDDVPEGTMGFLEHLDELRTRIIRSCIALAIGMLVAFAFIGRIADFVLGPTLRTLPPSTDLIMTRFGEGLSFYMDLALLGGVVLAAPFVTYQVWRFIAPGLYAREKRLVVPFIILATMGTLAGALFSHYVLFPSMVAFFSTFEAPRIRLMPRVEDTFGLYKNMLIGMVAVFQIPTLVFFLARLRVVTPRFLWRHFRYAVLISFVAAAFLTPSSDPWNQAVFAAPMIALYVISIGIAWVVAPRRLDSDRPTASPHLKLVFAASVIERASRRHRSPSRFPALGAGDYDNAQ
jgi:sec-independent protein translocase protein TatC